MKTGAHIALALTGALGLASMPLQAAEAWSTLQMKQKMAVSFDEGDKHIVGYFVEKEGACKLTLMIGASLRSLEAQRDPAPSRVVVKVPLGRSVEFDTIDGKSLSFASEDNARMMSALELDRLALNASFR